MDLAVAATAFVPLLLLELPDKTFVATVVLATRYRPLLAWIGVAAAFAVQCLVAVTAGGLISRLPDTPVAIAAGVLFAVGAVLLWRGAGTADAQEADAEREFAGKVTRTATGWRAVAASFVVVFLAEWGDLSQLFTAGLAARYADPVSVFAGSLAALMTVSGLAALIGRALIARIRLSIIRRAGAVVCALLAALTFVDALR